MKQLFLKSNLLHIRTNEGEFEVINPTAIGFSVVISDTMESFLNRFIKPGERIEWPGGIEKVCSCECQVKPMFCFFDCQQDKTIRIRLLPKEEKKHEWTTDEIMSMVEKKPAQPTPNFPKGGTTFTESAYKEFEGKGKLIGHIIDDFKNGKEIFVPAVESSEPQEKWQWFKCQYCDGSGLIHRYSLSVVDVSAPSESQEELSFEQYLRLLGVDKHHAVAVTIWDTLKHHKFTITRNP